MCVLDLMYAKCCVPINPLASRRISAHAYHTHSCSDIAASVESLQSIEILQTYGADFGVKSVHGATPMHKAVASGYVGPSVHLCMFDLWILVCDRVIPGTILDQSHDVILTNVCM